MPPAISDEEDNSMSEDLDTIPAKPAKPSPASGKKGSAKAKAAVEPESEAEDDVLEDAAEGKNDEDEEEEEEEEDGSSEEEGDTYVVEKILKHDFLDNGTCLYQVKWLGYEKANERTWEPEENLTEGASDLLKSYHDSLGGRPTQSPAPAKAKGKRKQSAGTATGTPEPRTTNGRSSKRTKREDTLADWQPPAGSWEDEVDEVAFLEQIPPKAGAEAGGTKGNLQGLIKFRNGKKKAYPLTQLRRKCPLKLLDYYEKHLYVPPA